MALQPMTNRAAERDEVEAGLVLSVPSKATPKPAPQGGGIAHCKSIVHPRVPNFML